ncbi:MAG: AMP-binding protein, partial [Acidobacteriota bacterium]
WRLGAARGDALSAPHRRETFVLGDAESAALRAAAARAGVSLNHLGLAAWGLLLARTQTPSAAADQHADVAFGTVVAGRPVEIPGIDEMVGLCANTVVLRLRAPWTTSLEAWMRHARDRALAAQAHGHSPLAEVQAMTAARGALVNHVYLFESFPAHFTPDADGAVEVAPGLRADRIEADTASHYDFQIAVFPEARIRFVLTHRPDAFPAGQAQATARALRAVLRALVETPTSAIGDAPLLDDVARQTHRMPPAAVVPSIAPAQRLAHLFADPVQRMRPALSADGVTLGWGALADRAEALAAQLMTRGVASGDRVALCLPADASFAIGIAAALRLGAAFVPIDPAQPAARIGRILDDARPKAMLMSAGDDASHAAVDVAHDAAVVRLDARGVADDARPAAASLPDPASLDADLAAYVLYTSGTTGTPKGVEVRASSLANYVDWLRDAFAIGPDDRAVLASSHVFDLGYTALFGCLLTGGCIDLFDDDARRDPERLIAHIARRGVSFLKLTPSLLRTLVHAQGAAALAAATRLRLVLLGGERFAPDDLRAFRDLCPQAALHNHYGPTEATIGCLSGPLDLDDPAIAAGQLVLGRPVRGAAVYVLVARGEPAID